MPKKQVIGVHKKYPASEYLKKHNFLRKGLIFLIIPGLIYFVFFCFYSWPWIIHFSTRFFTDQGDGLQNVWDMWWVNEAITKLHQLPWHTTLLHYPYGTTLVGQTLNPFNGLVAIPLLTVFSLVQAFNIMVVFSFIMGGLSAFWLCYYFTRRYIPSLIGGFIFTFSSYHFAHAIGHMQLVSLEWIPLFVLLWWMFVKRPSYKLAAGLVATLLFVLFCDYYYFLYCIAAALAIFIYLWRKGVAADFRQKKNYLPGGLFVGLSALLISPLPLALIWTNHKDFLLGSHPARIFSTDALSPFIDGGFWRFHALTNWYWHRVPAFVSEASVYLSIAVLATVVIALIKRSKINKDINFWIGLGLVFGIFSLGPRFMMDGHRIEKVPMPYVTLEKIIPGMKLSGVPVRMMVMVTLAAAIIAAMVLSKLDLKIYKHKVLLAVFMIMLFIELWPSALANNPATHPKYVDKLQQLPSTGAVLDNAALSESFQLYDQTVHQKPIVLGYISRVPTSVQKKDDQLRAAIDLKKYNQLCSLYGLRYITAPAWRPIKDNLHVIYQDQRAIIYDLKNSPKC